MIETAPFFYKVPDNTHAVGYRLVLNRQELLHDRGARFARDFARVTQDVFGNKPVDVLGIHATGELLATIGHIGRRMA